MSKIRSRGWKDVESKMGTLTKSDLGIPKNVKIKPGTKFKARVKFSSGRFHTVQGHATRDGKDFYFSIPFGEIVPEPSDQSVNPRTGLSGKGSYRVSIVGEVEIGGN